MSPEPVYPLLAVNQPVSLCRPSVFAWRWFRARSDAAAGAMVDHGDLFRNLMARNHDALRRFARYAVLPLLAACNAASNLAPVTEVSVLNATADTIAIQLLDRETSYLVDPVPERPTSSETDRLILPGGRRMVPVSQVMDYAPGKDLRVFIYRIRGARSVFSAIHDASAASLRLRGHDITIPATVFQSP